MTPRQLLVVGHDPGVESGTTVMTRVGNAVAHRYIPIELQRRAEASRLLELFHRLLPAVEVHPQLFVLEGYAMARGGRGTFTTGEFGGVLRLLLGAFELPYLVVPPTQLKKFATGKGTAKKEQVAVQCLKRWGVETSTSEQSDSYVLARMGLALLDGGLGLTKQQREIVHGLEDHIQGGHKGQGFRLQGWARRQKGRARPGAGDVLRAL